VTDSTATHPATPPARNPGAVWLIATGSAALIGLGLQLLSGVGGLPGMVGGISTLLRLLLTYLLGPIGFLVAMVLLAGIRNAGFASIIGTSRARQMLLGAFGAGLWLAQAAYLFSLFDTPATRGVGEVVRLVITAIVFVLGIVCAWLIDQAGVATGFARRSLLVALALWLVTLILFAGPVGASVLWDLPRILGVLILGVSWMHVGQARSTSVPASAKVLAE
jgi:hypothetical protein